MKQGCDKIMPLFFYEKENKMRTSSQLNAAGFCPLSEKVNISKTTQQFIRAKAQKELCLRALKGEPIHDIRGELESVMLQKGAIFENYEQKKSALDGYTVRIYRYLDYALRRAGGVYNFPTGDDLIVNIADEETKVLCDFIRVDGNEVYVTKLRTGRASTTAKNRDKNDNETYALQMLGEKLYPEKNVSVQYIYLGGTDARTERTEIEQNRPFEYRSTHFLDTKIDARKAEAFIQQLADTKEQGHHCSPEDCAGCGSYNICHFEEPPISVGCEREIKPLEDLHLTSAQRAVIDFDSGVARVNAGAGAGKTLVVALRAADLIRKGNNPEKICMITFTKTGAQEMQERTIRYLAGQEGLLEDPDNLTVMTINAFCQTILEDMYEDLGYTAKPRVIPEEVKSGIVNRILDTYPRIPEWKYGFTSSGGNGQKYRSFIKNALTSAKDIFSDIKEHGYTLLENPYTDQYSQESLAYIFQMYNEYTAQMKRRNLIDYSDQLNSVFQLLEIHPDLFHQMGWEHIIVDEFQDTDPKQVELLNKMIENPHFKSFMAVGDDSQSVYGFRGASPEILVHFGNYFGAFTDFNLVENHRSSGNIIDNANNINTLVEDRVEKDLIATKENGLPVRVEGFYSQKSEYEWIARDIADKLAQGMNANDIAVLTSDRYEISGIASELAKLGIPSIAMNPIPFKQNSRVLALCDFYDSFKHGSTRGMLEYANVLQHGALTDASAEELEQIISDSRTQLAQTAITVENFVELANRLDENRTDEAYQEFLEKVAYANTIEELDEFFNDFELYGDDSTFKREGHYDGVCLITVHSAKGMEWDTTYLILDKFDRPAFHTSPARNALEINETRRKWFVGATRAKKELITTGQYVLKHSMKDGVMLNDFLHKAYELQDKVYGYNSMSFFATQEEERQSEQQLA